MAIIVSGSCSLAVFDTKDTGNSFASLVTLCSLAATDALDISSGQASPVANMQLSVQETPDSIGDYVWSPQATAPMNIGYPYTLASPTAAQKLLVNFYATLHPSDKLDTSAAKAGVVDNATLITQDAKDSSKINPIVNLPILFGDALEKLDTYSSTSSPSVVSITNAQVAALETQDRADISDYNNTLQVTENVDVPFIIVNLTASLSLNALDTQDSSAMSLYSQWANVETPSQTIWVEETV